MLLAFILGLGIVGYCTAGNAYYYRWLFEVPVLGLALLIIVFATRSA